MNLSIKCDRKYVDQQTFLLKLLAGDGFCNDALNIALHNFDGGDCCGQCVVAERCTECKCKDGSGRGNSS